MDRHFCAQKWGGFYFLYLMNKRITWVDIPGAYVSFSIALLLDGCGLAVEALSFKRYLILFLYFGGLLFLFKF